MHLKQNNLVVPQACMQFGVRRMKKLKFDIFLI